MTNLEVMKQVAEGKITAEDAEKLLKTKKLTLKVSPKGAVQLDGLRRFPVTLYAEEWRGGGMPTPPISLLVSIYKLY